MMTAVVAASKRFVGPRSGRGDGGAPLATVAREM
jgi:hypothetical protein